MLKDCLSHEVMTTLMALVYCCEQEHHVFKKLILAGPLTNVVNTFDDNLIDNLARIPIYQNDPLVYDIPLVLELNLYSLQHLDATNNIMEPRL